MYLLSLSRLLRTLLWQRCRCQLRCSLLLQVRLCVCSEPNASPRSPHMPNCGDVLRVQNVCMFVIVWTCLGPVASGLGANLCGLMAGRRLGLVQKRTEELVWGVRVAAGVPEAYFRPAVPRAALCLLITSAENCSRSLVPRATVACRELLPVCDAESCS